MKAAALLFAIIVIIGTAMIAMRHRCYTNPLRCIAVWLVAIVAASFALGVLAGRASAHDVYDSWKTRNGISCCHRQDCAPATAWQDMQGHWYTRRDGVTYSVPDHAVLPIPSPDGRSHACIRAGVVLCLVPGEVRG